MHWVWEVCALGYGGDSGSVGSGGGAASGVGSAAIHFSIATSNASSRETTASGTRSPNALHDLVRAEFRRGCAGAGGDLWVSWGL